MLHNENTKHGHFLSVEGIYKSRKFAFFFQSMYNSIEYADKAETIRFVSATRTIRFYNGQIYNYNKVRNL